MIQRRRSITKQYRNLINLILVFVFIGSCSWTTRSVAAADQPIGVASDKMVTLHESRPLVARTGAWQTYNDHIQIRPGQEKRKLLITFINGADGRKPLTDVHVLLARKPFATMKDFDSSGRLSRDLTGIIEHGNTLLTVQVFGPSGARLVWHLFAEKPTITAVSPNPFGLSDKLVVHGNNFSDHPHAVKAFVAGKPLKVVSATSNELQLKLPAGLPNGEQELIVDVDSAKSDAFKVTVKAAPEVSWVDHMSAPPGQPVVIIGKNFSPVASENTVTFAGIKARVLSATETKITCIVPEMHFPRWNVAIAVTTNGAVSKTKGHIEVDIRVVPTETSPPE